MKNFFQIQAKKEEEAAEILLYGDIGDFFFTEGIGAKELAKEIKALGNIKQLDVRINSAGGSVFEGIAIYNVIERVKAAKNVYVDGLAASIASIIAMVGEKIIMAENATMMIHNPFGLVQGDAQDMRKMAENLDILKGQMITTYQSRSHLAFEEISSLMQQETWMTANEALAKGFATEVSKPVKIDASAYNLKNFKKVPSFLQGKSPCDGPEAKDKEAEALLNEIDETYTKIRIGGK